MQKQIKNKHIYNITEDKHIKAHKRTLIYKSMWSS